MTTPAFQQAVTYCEQALQSVTNCVDWLEQAEVSAPLYSAIIASIVTAVDNIQAVIDSLVETLQNQEAGYVISPIATVTGIPLTVAAATPLYVVPAGKTLVVTGWAVRNAVQVAPGGNAVANVNRLSDGAALAPTGTLSTFGVNQAWQFEPAVAARAFDTVAAGDTVQFNVSSHDTGTTNTVAVDLFGYLI